MKRKIKRNIKVSIRNLCKCLLDIVEDQNHSILIFFIENNFIISNTKTNITMITDKNMTVSKNAIITMALIIGGLLLCGCNKQPSADFTTDKTEYTAGEVVKCTNKSLNAHSYKWTFPDGQTATSLNVDYTLAVNSTPGVYSIKLEAISKNGNKRSEASKSITVKAATGKLTVWTSNSLVGPITVYVDNVNMGTITMYYASNPGCGANGCVTSTLTVGEHSISATDGTYTWNGTATITKDGCSTLQLQ